MFVSGAEQRRCERPDLYRKLLDGPQDAQLVELIKIGLFQTFFPHIRLFTVCLCQRICIGGTPFSGRLIWTNFSSVLSQSRRVMDRQKSHC